MDGFQRFNQFREGPTTKLSSTMTGPGDNGRRPASPERTCSLKATVWLDAVTSTCAVQPGIVAPPRADAVSKAK